MARTAAETVASEDVLSRKEQKHEPLYAGHVKVYPKDVKGRVRQVKWAALGLCLAVYYLLPWVRWDRGIGSPDQAVLLDLPNRRFYFFWIEIWPQEIYFHRRSCMILAALTACSWRPVSAGASGAATPAHRPSGLTCSCGSSGASRATATPGCASTNSP